MSDAVPDPAALVDVPVFPLPQLVLFPGTHLPLHFFEPRYRAMMEDIAAAGGDLLVVTQLKPGFERDYGERPPMHRVAGLGRIEARRKNPDGTHDVQLLGLSRVSLDELPAAGKPYRRARVQVLRDLQAGAGVPASELSALWSLASQVAACVQENDRGFQLLANPGDAPMHPARFIDQIADQLMPDADARQHVLETLDVRQRLRFVQARVAQLHLALLASDRGNDDSGGNGGRLLH